MGGTQQMKESVWEARTREAFKQAFQRNKEKAAYKKKYSPQERLRRAGIV
jgi:hypothetical protein